MRKSFVASALSALLAFGLAAGAQAQTVITQWNFDAVGPYGPTDPGTGLPGIAPFYTTATPQNSPAPSTGSGVITPLGMDNNYVFGTGAVGSSAFCDLTNASGIGDQAQFTLTNWRVRGPSNSSAAAGQGNGWNRSAPEYTQGAQFSASTVGYSGVHFSCIVYCTTQGVSAGQAQYTLDASAATPVWTSIGTITYLQSNDYLSPRSGALSLSNPSIDLDFSSIPGANNNAHFAVRFVSVHDPRYTLAGDYAAASSPTDTLYNNSSGNWRFGMITFSGSATGPINPVITTTNSAAAVCNAVDNDITFTAVVQPGINPASTVTAVTADLSQFGGSAAQSFTGDPTNTYFTYTIHVPAGAIAVPGSPVNRDAAITVADAQSRSATTHSVVKFANCTAGSSTSAVVISQIYGGGGKTDELNAGNQGVYESDYIEIYNRSASPVTLTGWSLQYSSATSTSGFTSTNIIVPLSGTIQSHQYMLIRCSDPIRGYAALPTPDFSTAYGTGGLGNTSGRALLSDATAAIGTAYTSTHIKDLVGYGAAAITYEGAGPAPTPDNAHAVLRKSTVADSNAGAQDTNQNFYDFASAPPAPHNRASNGSTSFLTAYASIPGTDPNAVVNAYGACTGSTVTFTVAVTPGSSSTGITVTANTLNITGVAGSVQLFDDGPAGGHGDALAGDGIFSLDYTVPANAQTGSRAVTFTAADLQSGSATSTLNLVIGNCTDSGAPVVITKVFGGGAHYSYVPNMDFVEILNRSSAAVDMTGWLMEYQDASNTFVPNKTVALSGLIGPGERRIIAPQPVPGIGLPIPNPDFSATLPGFGFDNHFGRVAICKPIPPALTAPILVTSGSTINAATAPAVVDLVGYGSATPTYEGNAPAGTLANGTWIVRKNNGTQDYNQNLLDFDVLYILAVPQSTRTLTVLKTSALSSGGTVVSDQNTAINCGAICSATFDRGTFVNLTAAPGPRSKFIGWSGACTGSGPCQVALADSATVTARFGCLADYNNSGGLEVQDIFDYLNAWFAGNLSTDFDGNPGLQVNDIFAFLNAWFAGC